MDYFQIIILGIIQGLTEFLPISSSGHLAIATRLFGANENLPLIVILHLGTMFATFWVFWDDIERLFLSLFTIPKAIKEKKLSDDLKMVIYIIVASIPTALLGLFFKDKFEALSSNTKLVGIMLIFTGVLLLITKWLQNGKRKENDFGIWRSLIVGTAQGLAIMPGISRSGSTIATTLYLGGEREFAGRFSFLISLPAITGANLLEWHKVGCPLSAGMGRFQLIVGFLTAFIVGLIALKFLLGLIKKGKVNYFAYYCFVIGILTIVLL